MRSLRLLFLANGLAFGVLYNFVPVLLQAKGFDAPTIGLAAGLGAIGFTLALPVWGHIGDVLSGPRRALQIACIPAAIIGVCYVLPLPVPAVIVILVGLTACGGAAPALTDAIAVTALPDFARRYSGFRLSGSAAAGIGAIACGLIYSVTGYLAAPVLFLAPILLTIGAAQAVPQTARVERDRVSDRPMHRRAGRGHPLRTVGEALGAAPRLGVVLLAVVILFVPVTIASTYGTLRVSDLGSGPVAVGLLNGLASLVELPGMVLGGWLVRRVGAKRTIVMAGFVLAACVGSWVPLTDPVAMILTRALVGGCFAMLSVALVLSVAAMLPDRLVSTGQTLLQASCWGAASLVANIVGGQLYATVGAAGTFGMAAVLAVAGALLVGLALPRSADVHGLGLLVPVSVGLPVGDDLRVAGEPAAE
jgi:MFS family permease